MSNKLSIRYNERGIAHILLILLLLIGIAVGIYLVTNPQIFKSRANLQSLTNQNKKDPTVSLQTEYKNPFDKNAQYVNPFTSYHNPFDSLK